MIARFRAFVARIPTPVRGQAIVVGRHFVTSFVASLAVFIPGVLAAPNFSTARSVAVAAVLSSATAAARATAPLAKAAVRKVAAYFLGA